MKDAEGCWGGQAAKEDRRRGDSSSQTFTALHLKFILSVNLKRFNKSAALFFYPFPSSCILQFFPSTRPLPLTLHSFFYSPAAFPLHPESAIVVPFCFFLLRLCVPAVNGVAATMRFVHMFVSTCVCAHVTVYSGCVCPDDVMDEVWPFSLLEVNVWSLLLYVTSVSPINSPQLPDEKATYFCGLLIWTP